MDIKYLDLFSGMGGMRLGLEQSLKNNGYTPKCIGTYEIKKHAIKQLQYYFKEDNIKNLLYYDFSKKIDFDILIGGFPCQPFSKAGSLKGFDDNRGNFIFNIFDILNVSKPRFFILENVDNILSHDKGKTITLIIDKLKELGYNIDFKVLNTKDFGLPQNRKRLFIIGDLYNQVIIPDIVPTYKNFNDIIESNIIDIQDYENKNFTNLIINKYNSINFVEGKYLNDKRGGDKNIHSWELELYGKVSEDEVNILNIILSERRKREYAKELNIEWKDGNPLTYEQILRKYNKNNLLDVLNILEEKKYIKRKLIKEDIYGYSILTGRLSFPFSYFIKNNSISNTVTATEMHKFGVVDNKNNVIRKITKREGLRMFGFPEEYNFSNELKLSECYDLLGNTLGVNIINFLTNALLK